MTGLVAQFHDEKGSNRRYAELRAAIMTISDIPGLVNNIIVHHPHVECRTGEPFVRGSRVRIATLFELYRGGVSVERIIKRYPQLPMFKVFDALAFAVDNRHLFEKEI